MADQNYYDDLFGGSSDEEAAPPSRAPPQQKQTPSKQRAPQKAAPNPDVESDYGGDSSSSESQTDRPRKRFTKAGKVGKKPPRARQDDSGSDDDDDAQKPRPTTGYEEEPNERGMDESDEEYHGDSSDQEEVDKKKSKGKKVKSSSSVPRRLSGGEGGGKKDKDIVDIAMDKLKKKRVKDPDDKQITEICEDLVETFERALRDDKISMESRQPATHKIRAIDNMLRLMGSRKIQDAMLEKHQLLTHIKLWIKPMDKTKELPLHMVRSKLIEFLSQLPVEVDQLKESGIGKVVQLLYKHKDETLPNKQILKRIIDKWSNQIMNKGTNYRNKVMQEDDEENVRGRPPTSAPTYFESSTSRGVKIARRTGYSFKVMPQPKVTGVGPTKAGRRDDEAEEVADRGDDDGANEQSKKELVRKRMAELSKKPNTKKLRAANVSTN